ncbi:MAG TPA: ATP-binding protein [Puia sp.]|nr:ATP-binding protein [Puia sp.]
MTKRRQEFQERTDTGASSRSLLSRRFRNVSIAKKLYFTVGIMALLIALELGVLIFSIHTLSSVRAYVNGEALWSKSQKDAMYQLLQYGLTSDQRHYDKFQEFMKVPMGDRATLQEFNKEQPDLNAARQGFIQGRNDRDDVDGMIRLFSRFSTNQYISRAITAWKNADRVLSGFQVVGEKLHKEISGVSPSQDRINAILREMDPLNVNLTVFEDEFSYSLGEGSRWLERLVLRVLFFVALTVECTGLILAITVSRGIQKGLNEILLSARSVTRGDFSRKAKSFSRDEIGILANNFNRMSEELERLGIENREVNNSLEKKVRKRTAEMESKNKELEQFAYVASHDLQEPLRTTSAFVELFQKEYRGRLDDNADKYLEFIVQASDRMKVLVKDLLDYSRIGKEKKASLVNCNKLLEQITEDLAKMIKESGAIIEAYELPAIHAYPTELKLLFQNLITNAIKFRRQDRTPVIRIRPTHENGYWKFLFADNGIGIEKAFHERIFVIFQRLHNRSEYEGSGIGLAHCKKIAELHGGRIWVESVPGEGSEFFFTISADI